MHVDIPGLMWGGHVQHSEDDFIDLPNVIVAHFADGIEVRTLLAALPGLRQEHSSRPALLWPGR